ncbi:MAG: hypothetical protein Kow0025_15800 [Thermodesulfovibrionales bacterium]
MRNWRNLIICLCLLLPLSGCVVYSLNPFYTEEKVIHYPEALGEWECVEGCGGEFDFGRDWRFRDGSVEVTDREGRRTVLSATFFRLGDTVFLDTTVPELDTADIAKIHLLPAHLLSRVEMGEDEETLRLTGLDYVWFRDASAGLPFIVTEDTRVFVATPEQWASFLHERGGMEEIYGESFVLKRKKPAASAG